MTCIIKSDNILLLLGNEECDSDLIQDFAGTVVYATTITNPPSFSQKVVYLCGDVNEANKFKTELSKAQNIFVIHEYSRNHETGINTTWQSINVGRVPLLMHGVCVYYRRFFEEQNYFHKIKSEHTFQTLTESTKPGTAHRTGAYLTPVEKREEEFHFRLLRCSTNFSGPTLNFKEIDTQIVNDLNKEASSIFKNHSPLNHVLAQIYNNSTGSKNKKGTKAKIKAHADKTKDMPQNGLLAFCTFYDQLEKLQPMGDKSFDFGRYGCSGLTRLHFRLKQEVAERPGCNLRQQFEITLYPGSVLFMPLSTNRLYTHEIRPSSLEVAHLPTRLGYVVRCSDTEAVHKDNQTYIKVNDKLVELGPPTTSGMADLRALYTLENKTDAVIDYDNKFNFSMNEGDYLKPEYQTNTEEFRSYHLPFESNIFHELLNNVTFDDITKGRKGAVIVKPDKRGTPVVRTTSKYSSPAQCFKDAHLRLAEQIEKKASSPLELNNALIEVYGNGYTNMGFHSDQAIDLKDGSFIALFSCYKFPEQAQQRKLVVESKEAEGKSRFEIPLTQNSLVIFSLGTNSRFKHKIVLDKSSQSNVSTENEWLGVTFRTSKTFLQYEKDGVAHMEDGSIMTLANENELKDVYKMRRQENRETNYKYPKLTYTISKSDIMPPRK